MRQDRTDLIRSELARIDGVLPGGAAALIKHVKMAGSPLQFFRGSPQLFYHDIANGHLPVPAAFLKVPMTRIVGDCHVGNFGFLTEEGSYGDRVIFAPNDYDDAAEAHAVFDLLRACVSLFLWADFQDGLIAGRYSGADAVREINALSQKDAQSAARTFLKEYRKTCAAIIEKPDVRDEVLDSFERPHFLARSLEKAIAGAPGGKQFREKSSVGKLAVETEDGIRFDWNLDKLVPLDDQLVLELCEVFRPHFDDAILDVARRVGAGTSSLILDRFYFLVGPDEPPSEETFRETHIVEVKQQREAALIHFFPDLSPVNRMNAAHLTIDCQRRMMRKPDLVLDEVEWMDACWLVRSRHHARRSVAPESLVEVEDPVAAIKEYASACGQALARTHSRGDRRSVKFELAMVEALQDYDVALAAISEVYAQTVFAGHGHLQEMLQSAGVLDHS